MDNIASVVISNCTRKFDKQYHYIIPDNLKSKIAPGIRVIVPFGNLSRNREGYVIELLDRTKVINLKEIVKVVDDKPVLKKDMIKLALWMKDRYICTCFDAIKCMIPSGIGMKSTRIVKLVKYADEWVGNAKKIMDILRECNDTCEYSELQKLTGINSISREIKKLEQAGLIILSEQYSPRIKEKYARAAHLAISLQEAIDEIESERIKKIHQIKILEMLIDNEYIPVADIIRSAGISRGVLDTLKKRGYIAYKDMEIKRDPIKVKPVEKSVPLKLTPSQSIVFERLNNILEENQFGEVLLHGVTGSGKTEVYLQLIKCVIEMGKQAIVLVPEISLTPQMVERFVARFGKEVAVLHSRLSLGERYDQWRLIRDGEIKVAVGARSAVFAPFDDLGIIIIDEEHVDSYKSEITPKYHTRDVARKRCRNNSALLLYGSATPSIETYYRAEQGLIELCCLSERANKMQLPKASIVDMRKELDDGNRSIFSRKLHSEIEVNIRSGQQTMLFLNRRGYASFVLCRKCGYAVKCINCNITLTYHTSNKRLICHYCGYTIKSPQLCPRCTSKHIKHFGTGTQKIEEEIKREFNDCSVIRMDMDTTTYKNSHEEILRTFRDENINIMVGTQMIAKGHDFHNVTLVGVLAADSLLNIGDFRAAEKTFQLITQVSGRAGRGQLPGRVVIQTYNTEDYSIIAACEHNYSSFYKQEKSVRRNLKYPPFVNIAVVILRGIDDRSVYNYARNVKESIRKHLAGYKEYVDVLGPARAPLSKIKNKYRWRIVIKCRDNDTLINVLGDVSDAFYTNDRKRAVELIVDINPVNML